MNTWRKDRNIIFPAWFWSYNGNDWGLSFSFDTIPSNWTHWMPMDIISFPIEPPKKT